MILSDVAIRRPVLAVVVNLLLVVLGVVAFDRLAVREYPDIDAPVVSVSTSYSGSSAQIIETQITQVIEEAVSGIEGITTIRSSSRDGQSTVRLEFSSDTPLESATNDVRDAVNRSVGRLPDDADTPIVRKVDANATPIMFLTMTSDRRDAMELTDMASRLVVDRLATVPGVAQVSIAGQRQYAMRIWLDRTAMAARGITVPDIEAALRAQNVELPAGRVESTTREFTVRTDTRMNDVAAFTGLVLAERDGYLVRLGEVATVEIGPRDQRGGFRTNGMDAIGVQVARQSTANTLEVAQAVRDAVASLSATLPDDVVVDISSDDSVFIAQSLEEVYVALAIALGLVLLVVFIFLRNVRATLIPILAVPVSITGSFIVIAAMGYSINVLTLLACVLAIGLVVDDAIVVLENISRRIELGEPPLVAAFLGARQIGFAVVTTTAVLCAVFVPISFLEGDIGRVFAEFGISLASAVAFSGLVALTLTPMLCGRILQPAATEGGFHRATQAIFDGLARGYRRALNRTLAAPLLPIALGLALCYGVWALLQALPQEFAPTEDRGSIFVSAQAPEGATLEYTRAEAERIEEILNRYLESGEASRMLSIIAPGFGGGGVNRAIFITRLAPWDERERSQQDIVRELNQALGQISGIRANALNPGGIGRRGSNNPVRVVLGGPSYEQLVEWRDQLNERLRDARTVENVQFDYDETKPELRLVINRNRAADLGISIRDIGQTLETMLGGRTVTRYVAGGIEYDVVVQARAEDRQGPGDLSNIFVRADSGALVPLASLISLSDAAGPTELNRYDRMRAITLTAALAPGARLGAALDEVEQIVRETAPEARISYDGESREFREASSSLYGTFGMALLIVFLVLAAQFESFVHPVTILLTVPLALFGALGSIWLLDRAIDIYVQIGMVMLIGLVAKNAILIVEFANQLRDQGMAIREAVLEASVIRLRPILMTSIATAFGALPLALATGAGAESRQAIGIVVAGGVAFSTFLSLFLVPTLYLLLARFSRPASATARRLDDLLATRRPGAQPEAPVHPAE